MAAADWLGFDVLDAPAVSNAALTRVHDPAHVETIRQLAGAGGGSIDGDTFVGEGSYRAALHAAGGACRMVELLLGGQGRVGFSGLRPAGHHAESARVGILSFQ